MTAASKPGLRVLVPVDFSETSRRALAWAFDYAMRAPCEIHVVHVIETKARDAFDNRTNDRISRDLEAVDEETRGEMDAIVPPGDRPLLGHMVRHVAEGNPARVISKLADELEVDLIVMGTHGRSGIAHFLFGSVAEKVLRRAPCPVVCVKPIQTHHLVESPE
jgi:nucleotide-binding universal stress UspA family protein